MFKRLRRLFTGVTEAPLVTTEAHDDESRPVVTEPDKTASRSEIDRAFTGMLLGVNALVDDPLSTTEKSFLDSVHDRFLRKTMPEYLIPRLPAVIPKVMLALRAEETDVAGLANILSGDMVLVGEVIRLANSPYYRRTRELESLDQAIINIGFNGIRQMIISASLKPILSTGSGHLIGASGSRLWSASMDAGLLSDCVAKRLGVDRFHAYLAGLIGLSGMAVLIKELDHYFTGQAPRNRQFIDRLNRYVQEISAGISEQWDLPGPVSSALREQISCDDPMTCSMPGRICYLSDKQAKVRILKANGYLEAFDEAMMIPDESNLKNIYMHCQEQVIVA